MEKRQLSECLKKVYLGIREKDGSFFKVSSLKAIRTAVERFLKSVPNSKHWSIISDPQFKEANDALDAFAKSIRRRKSWRCRSPWNWSHHEIADRNVIWTTTTWSSRRKMSLSVAPHFVVLYHILVWEKRKRKPAADDENHTSSSKNLTFKTVLWTSTTNLGRSLSDEKPPRRLIDEDDESNGKMFEVPGSQRCPVQTVENYISHLNPETEFLFQKRTRFGFCNSPLGISYLSFMMRTMSQRRNQPSAQQPLC